MDRFLLEDGDIVPGDACDLIQHPEELKRRWAEIISRLHSNGEVIKICTKNVQRAPAVKLDM